MRQAAIWLLRASVDGAVAMFVVVALVGRLDFDSVPALVAGAIAGGLFGVVEATRHGPLEPVGFLRRLAIRLRP